MANQLSVILERFGIVKFSLLQRQPDPCWHIRFRSPDGRRVVRPTKKTRHKDAAEAASAVIAAEYGIGGKPPVDDEPTAFIFWDQAIALMKKEMAAAGLRSGTVEDYCTCLQTVRNSFTSGVLGPNDVTDRHAREYAEKRMRAAKAVTVRGNIVKLRALWTKWFIDRLGICGANPWEGVDLPRVDKKDPRVLTDAEEVKFLRWLATKFAGWRLPGLWFQVKGFVGSRSFDITALRTEQLQDGCIFFPAETTKGREDRPAPLPPAVYQELLALAGPDYVFETFHKGLRECYKQNGLRCGNYSCKRFSPRRMIRWLQNVVADFRKLHPEVPYFKPHNWRGTAITRALELMNGNIDAVAIAFDCNPDTIRKYYAGLNKKQVARDVLGKLQARPVPIFPEEEPTENVP
jgi:integrase